LTFFTVAHNHLGISQIAILQARGFDVSWQLVQTLEDCLESFAAQPAPPKQWQTLEGERDRLRLLLEVSESIASHRDVAALIQDLAQRLPRVVPFDVINLVLYDPERDSMRLHALVAPECNKTRPGLEFHLSDTTTGWVWESQRPLMVEDVTAEKRFPRLMSVLRDSGVRSYCTVPLTSALRRLGAMSFGSVQKRIFQKEEIAFMQQVARQVAVAVDNVLHDESARQAQQQLARERDRVRLLLEVNNAVVSHLHLEDLFPAVSACLRRVVQHDGSALVLHDEETRSFRVHLLRFAKNESFIEEGEMASDSCAKGPSGIAMATRKLAVFGEEDLKALSSKSPCAQKMVAEGVRTYCSVPLLSHDRAMGAMNVGRLSADPFSPEDIELLSEVGKQVSIAVENAQSYRELAELKDKLAKEKGYLEEEVRTEHNFGEIVGNSAALRKVLKEVETVAPTISTVLIHGETGTGKELIARALHHLSPRQDRTFVKLNCAAIPTGLLESELFGHEKGAFTGAITQRVGRLELANGGTLFLDEVGDIPLELQPKLLRALQEQEFERLGSTRTIRVDVRLVAATNRDLAQMVAGGQFRTDLFYRLNVFPVFLPPLRERSEDIPLLIRHFTQQFAKRMSRRIESIPAEVMTALVRYPWPGNVREIQNVIERAVILSQNGRLRVDPQSLASNEASQKLNGQLDAREREAIEGALRASNGRVSGPKGAAKRLGLPHSTLEFRIKKLSIDKFQFRRKEVV
jgi:formate hydrogenlyase transcriptional activator